MRSENMTNTRKPYPTYQSAKPASKFPSLYLGFDVPLLITVIFLVSFGLLMLYSASWDYSLKYYGFPGVMFTHQIKMLIVGIIGLLVCANIDYHHYRRLILPVAVVVFASLLAVFAIGEYRHGAIRTLNNGSIMPSEAAKMVFVVYLSVWLYNKRNVLHRNTYGLIPLALIIGAVAGAIFLQPDISAAMTIIFLGIFLFFLAGGKLKQIFLVFSLAVIVGWGILQGSQTAEKRLGDFVNGLNNPANASYHVQRATEAFLEGGWFGVGIGNSEIKLLGLPVPPTDSIFAVIGEETGMLGTTIVIIGYSILLFRGMVIAKNSPDMLGSLIAAGLSFWIAVEAFINMGVLVGLLPFAGNALPFISYGGSSLIATLCSIGIIMNISKISKKEVKTINESPQRNYYATDGMRRSKRRGRVSSPGSAPSLR
jgi:cell division protein FtsW